MLGKIISIAGKVKFCKGLFCRFDKIMDMKNLFPGYYKKNEEEIKNIWEKGIIFFDTNVLLNLYRYSDSTRDTLLDLIGKFSKQIFLPHQAVLEYNRNRYEVIAEQEKAHEDFLSKISQIQSDLQSTNKPPFLSEVIDDELNEIFIKVSNEVKHSIDKYCKYLNEDPIYNKISDLFENKITDNYSVDELSKIYKDGEDRYKLKIPPGFADEKNKEGVNKFGDLILWKQIIDKAKLEKRDVILITDERKVDWWWKIRDGRNMGPRQELVEEIKNQAGVAFHMYSSEKFLSYGQDFLKEKINQKAVEEIQAMKTSELEQLTKFKEWENNRLELSMVHDEINSITKQINEIEGTINAMDNDIINYNERNISKYYEGEEMDKELPDFYKVLISHRDEFMAEKNQLYRQIADLNARYSKLWHLERRLRGQ